MLHLHNLSFESGSLIELVLHHDMHHTVFTKPHQNTFVIDTKGNSTHLKSILALTTQEITEAIESITGREITCDNQGCMRDHMQNIGRHKIKHNFNDFECNESKTNITKEFVEFKGSICSKKCDTCIDCLNKCDNKIEDCVHNPDPHVIIMDTNKSTHKPNEAKHCFSTNIDNDKKYDNKNFNRLDDKLNCSVYLNDETYHQDSNKFNNQRYLDDNEIKETKYSDVFDSPGKNKYKSQQNRHGERNVKNKKSKFNSHSDSINIEEKYLSAKDSKNIRSEVFYEDFKDYTNSDNILCNKVENFDTISKFFGICKNRKINGGKEMHIDSINTTKPYNCRNTVNNKMSIINYKNSVKSCIGDSSTIYNKTNEINRNNICSHQNYTLNNNLLVVIDSLSFIMDEMRHSFDHIKKCFSAIWDCIYENNVTFIVVNHYKAEYKNKKILYIPRFGTYWRSQMSYTVLCEWQNNKINFKKI
ncbi:hypothetical protein COBT_000822 [Conglomerata obtusa]